jgi:hypothetical protein
MQYRVSNMSFIDRVFKIRILHDRHWNNILGCIQCYKGNNGPIHIQFTRLSFIPKKLTKWAVLFSM